MPQRRDVVERCVNRSKHWRGVASRFAKRAVQHRTTVTIAALMSWLADPSDTP